MVIKKKKKVDVTVVEPQGEIDFYNSPSMREELNKILAKKQQRILVNLEKVTYIDSSGLATLIEALQKLTKSGGWLGLTGLTRPILNVFEVAGLDDIFKIYLTEEEALADGSN